MPVPHYPVESAIGQELRKWEQHRTRYAPGDGDADQPGNPYTYRPFPKMLYKAQRHPVTKQWRCCDIDPDPANYASAAEYERMMLILDRFNRSCQLIVTSEDEMRVALNDGWRHSPTDALEAHAERAKSISDETARRHFSDQRMSESAQAEAAAADAATSEHVPDVPRKRGN